MAETSALRQLVPARLTHAVRRVRTKWLSPQAGVGGSAYRVPCIRARQDGATLYVPGYARHRPAARAVLSGAYWEPDTRRLVAHLMERRSGDIVHAGTFFGDMLPHFSAVSRRLYAFEPVLENYVLARLCVIENDLENVVLIHAGLSDATGTGRIATADGAGRHAGGASQLAETGQIVTLLEIDAIVDTEVAIIQLDVEGHELPALRGARCTIEKSAPFVLIEDNGRACGPLLEEFGYRKIGSTRHLFLWAHDRYAEAASAALEDVLQGAKAAR